MSSTAASAAQTSEPQGYRRVVLGGLAWKAASRGLFEVTRVAVAVALARLLTPNEYGLAGMVLVLANFEPTVSGTGLASALIQRERITEADRSTVFWTNLGVATACSIGCIALAQPVAHFYHSTEVQPLFAAMSLVFVLSALGSTHAALLTREMNFRALELRAMAGVVVGAVAAIVVAVKGYGPWALVAQQLGAFGVSTLLLWAFSSWYPSLTYSRKSMRALRGFGGHISGMLLLFQLNQTVDRVLIGRVLGATYLGAYALASNVILVPFSRLAAPLHDVLYPVFSRVQNDLQRLASIWLRSITMIGAVAIPSLIGLMVVAPDFVVTVFGKQWESAIPIVQILSWVGLLLVLQGLNSVVLQSLGMTKTLFRYAIVSFVASMASFVIGLHWGIVGVAACYAIASTIVQPLYMRLTARAIGIGMRDCLRALGGVFQASLAVALAAYVARQLTLEAGFGPGIRLLIEIGAGIAVYIPMCAWRAGNVWSELGRLTRRGRRVTPAADVV